MASKRYKSKRKRSFKRNNSKRASTATIKAVINANRELKGIDQEFGPGLNNDTATIESANMANSNFVFPINLINQGQNYMERIGKTIQLKSFRLKGYFRCSFSANNVPPRVVNVPKWVRCLVIWDKQPTGVLPRKEEFIETTLFNNNTSSRSYNLTNMTNSKRFSMLFDKTWTLTRPNPNSDDKSASDTITNMTYKHIDIYKDLKSRRVQYLSTQTGNNRGLISDIASGALYVCFLTDVPNVNDIITDLDFIGSSRLRFYDS